MCLPAKPAGASRRPSLAAQPSGATSSQAQPGSAPLDGGMPPMLRVRAAQQPRPAKGVNEESCSICSSPKIGECATCGLPSCKDHFNAITRRCVACTQRKSLPVEQAEWDEQWQRHSADPNFRAQQQKLLDDFNADKLNMQRMKEQAEEQLRLSSE
eukprot:6820996-Pyramimonas_sp.AAC.2